jgi:hypothetical protein
MRSDPLLWPNAAAKVERLETVKIRAIPSGVALFLAGIDIAL